LSSDHGVNIWFSWTGYFFKNQNIHLKTIKISEWRLEMNSAQNYIFGLNAVTLIGEGILTTPFCIKIFQCLFPVLMRWRI
jgi:hypothetical protein